MILNVMRGLLLLVGPLVGYTQVSKDARGISI